VIRLHPTQVSGRGIHRCGACSNIVGAALPRLERSSAFRCFTDRYLRGRREFRAPRVGFDVRRVTARLVSLWAERLPSRGGVRRLNNPCAEKRRQIPRFMSLRKPWLRARSNTGTTVSKWNLRAARLRAHWRPLAGEHMPDAAGNQSIGLMDASR